MRLSLFPPKRPRPLDLKITLPVTHDVGNIFSKFEHCMVFRFHHAMLRIARTMLSQDVRPSVCPSVTRRYCANIAKRIIKLFSPSSNHAVLVFRYQCYSSTPTTTLLTGASNAGVWKHRDFPPNVSLCLGNDTRYGHSYHWMRIGNRTTFNSLEWPWMTIAKYSVTRSIARSLYDSWAS